MGFIIDAAAHAVLAFGLVRMCCNINQMIYLAEIKFFPRHREDERAFMQACR